MSDIELTVTYRGGQHHVSFPPQTSLAELKDRLEDLTSVPSSLQKLLYRGKRTADDEAVATLVDVGLKTGVKVTLMGSTSEELNSMRDEEKEARRKYDILRRRQAAGPSRLSSTLRPTTSELNYRFHRIEPLRHLPNPNAAAQVLNKLAGDPAIQHVMRKHKFAVGLLTELAPHEHPELLGLNVNAGQEIKLRLRTNAYDGMRTYKETRRVLCHELSHNVHGDHDDDFKTLNSLLNREVDEYERSVRSGTHSLSGLSGNDYYEPLTDAESHSNVLGGGSSTSSLLGGREEMRTRALEAALQRQQKEEQEIEEHCGSDGPAALR